MKIGIIISVLLVLVLSACRKSVSPTCWGAKEHGMLYYLPNCPEGELTAWLVLDSNPADTLQVRNHIPKKFQKDSIRVQVAYKEVTVGFTTQQCVGSGRFVKITCIKEE